MFQVLFVQRNELLQLLLRLVERRVAAHTVDQDLV
jgi:hypothetical protein